MENIHCGRPAATAAEVPAAARVPHAAGYMRKLPAGYASRVAEPGHVSAAGRQLGAMTRAVWAQLRVLVRDGAPSSAAARAEMRRQAAFRLDTMLCSRLRSHLHFALAVSLRPSSPRSTDAARVLQARAQPHAGPSHCLGRHIRRRPPGGGIGNAPRSVSTM